MSGSDFAYAEGIGFGRSGTAVVRADNAAYVKVAHDLMKYMMESGQSTANCARAAERALLSTGWERTNKVSDVADTVYNVVSAKWTCDKEVAELAREWLYGYLNVKLDLYIREPDTQPEPVGYQPGAVVEPVTEAMPSIVKTIMPFLRISESGKDTKIENLDTSIKGDEVTVTAYLHNYGSSTEEVKAKLWIGSQMVDEEPDIHWRNVRGGESASIKLTTAWKPGDIEGALGGKVKLYEQHLGFLDEKEFGLGAAGIVAWVKGLGYKGLAGVVIVVIVILIFMVAMMTPQAQAAQHVYKKVSKAKE